MNSSVDWSLIDKHEIPTDFGYAIPGNDNSGITVIAGFDLGAHDCKQIDALSISNDLKAKLKPYASLKGAAARNALYSVPEAFDPSRPIGQQIQKPVKRVVSNGEASAYVLRAVSGGLQLTTGEVQQLTSAVRSKKLGVMVKRFDAAAPKVGGKPFATIPATCQTAIVLFCWQYGENVALCKETDRRRQYWNLVVKNDWSGAIELLIHKFMGPSEKSYARRRLDEIWLLMLGLGKQGAGPGLQKMLLQAEQLARTA